MAWRTIIEYSEAVRSPNGLHAASIVSRTTSAKMAISQASVEHSQGGCGLVAFHVPRVAMAFSWRSDEELVVRYPEELPKPRIDATNDTFGLGGKGRVIYEPVPRLEIPPVRWARAGSLTVVAEKKLERGVLLTFDADGRREHAFSYYDTAEVDSSSKALRARKLQGGGPSWAGIVHGLLALRAPEVMGKVELDPEGDGLTVRSPNRAALLRVAKLVALAKKDEALLLAAIDRAMADGEME